MLAVQPVSGPVPLPVRLDSSASHDSDGRIVRRELSVDGAPFEEVEENHQLTLASPGAHQISLRVSDDSGRTALDTKTVTAEPGSAAAVSFQIDLYFPSARVSPRERQAYRTAADRWTEVVVGGLPDKRVRPGQVEQACGSGYNFSGEIDDLLLIADVREIDGPAGVIGMASACLLRPDGFPLVGVIVLDRADVDLLAVSGDLHSVVSHEFGHVLDLSLSGWERRGLLAYDRSDCHDSRPVYFTGAAAANEFAKLGGSGPVPVEDNGVRGTACSHWHEEALRSELMTGYLDKDAKLSRITAAALADMGYQVDQGGTDDYLLPVPGSPRPQAASLPLGERLLAPGGILDEAGDLIPLPAQNPVDLELRLPGR